MIKFKKIRFQLQLILGIFVLLIISLLVIIHITTLKRSLINEYREKNLFTVLKASQSSFHTILHKAIETSELLAEDPTLTSWFLSGEKDDKLKQLALSRLDFLQKNYNYPTVFAVNSITKNYWSEDFNLLDVVSGFDPDDSWFYNTIDNKIKTSLNFDYNRDLNKSILFVNVIMGKTTNPIGVAGVGIDPSMIITDFNQHKPSPNSRLWLVEGNGNVIMSQNVKEINFPISRQFNPEVVDMILSDNKENAISNIKHNKTKVELAYMPLYNGRYKLIMTVPRVELFPIFSAVEKQTAIFSVLFLLITLVIVNFLSRGITTPLLRLKKLSDSIAKGNLETSTDNFLLSREDEIGSLARAFENMKMQISNYIHEINTTNDNLKTDKEKLRKTNQRLNQALIKASESEKLTQAFLANISHEIRTPMNSIMGFSQILEACESDPKEFKEYTDLILKGSEQLLSILDSIINLSKIESGVMKPKWDKINLAKVIKETYDIYTIAAERENLKMILDIPDENNSVHIVSDYALIQQVLNNLISNSLKYTKEGYIKIGYTIQPEMVVVYVEDSGIGISNKDQKYIFEPFRQVTSNHSVKTTGAGLGLAIVNKISNILHGKISVESTKGKGSIFYFKLPNTI